MLKFSIGKTKKINRIALIAFGVMAVTVAVLFKLVEDEETNLLKHGLRDEVVVVQKYKNGIKTKYSTPQYYMAVDWFTQLEQTPYYKTKDTTNLSNAEKMSNEMLSKIFKDKGRKRIERLRNTVKLKYIDGYTYTTVSVGDIVTLVYFKDKPEEGRLLIELE